VLAFSAGTVAADATTGVGAAPAAAETTVSIPQVDVPYSRLKRVDSIELGAESLVFRRGDRTVADVSMRDARSTVSLLNRLLGTPSRTQTAVGDGGACFPSGTTYTWGGAVRVAALTAPAQAGNEVEIRVLKDVVRSRSGARVDLTGPGGVQVGDDVADELRDAPRSDKVSFGSGDEDGAWQLLLEAGWDPDSSDEQSSDEQSSDEQSSDDAHRTSDDRPRTGAPDDDATDSDDAAHDDESGTNGVSALTNGATVTVLGSPMPVHAQRSC